jgi:hypothetical protein
MWRNGNKPLLISPKSVVPVYMYFVHKKESVHDTVNRIFNTQGFTVAPPAGHNPFTLEKCNLLPGGRVFRKNSDRRIPSTVYIIQMYSEIPEQSYF